MYETSQIHRHYHQLERRREVTSSDLVPQRLRDIETVRPRSVRLHLFFERVPAAADVATALLIVDRETRRITTAIERGVDPVTVRGAALGPRSRGFEMQRADPGSLDVVLQATEAIYAAITSQPLSFALNVASLTQLGHFVRKAILRGGSEEDTITLAVPPRQPETAPLRRPSGETDDGRLLIAVAGREPASIPLPDGMTKMSLVTEYADGSGETITFERRPPTE